MIAALLAAAIASPAVYDVLISAGHEGRPASCARFPTHACNLGARGERAWTPIVADAATAVLRAHGVSVAREPADFAGTYRVGMALFLHFDGAVPACVSGASIGYHSSASAPAARAWHALYARYFPFRWQPDDFTVGLRDYYAYKQIDARDGSLVLELGEITCPAQHAWLKPRLHWLGALLAYFVSRRIGRGDVPAPGPYPGG
ncbi:MAG TPA: hypothetical protein VMH02_06610 [Verrucomicrobiae bacterium]|nr:hypothetical protein [Verrucomicrobiae bacterium]